MPDVAPPFALYNPSLLPPEVLLAEFTARRPLLNRLLEIVRDNKPGQPPQHVLLVGPRGMGKTTLLCAVSGSIATAKEGGSNADLKPLWQPVIFDEESRRIGDLADFWLECIRQWDATTEPSLMESRRVDALLTLPEAEVEDRARDEFLKLVDASGRRALLLIDNINDIFSAIHHSEPLMRLRSFLMADSRVMIIGAATQWFTDVTNVDKPFFEFFREFELAALNFEEMTECLRGIAIARGDQAVLDALEKRPGSIRSLHILTGGNPRLIRTFYRLLNEGMNGELRQQLERLIDDYTPYLKAIIDALPGQQQRVLDAIALQWNPCDVATVSRVTRIPSNQVSAQIRAMTKQGLVSEVEAMGTQKKKAYMLTDRFSNIHYLMRHGRSGQKRMHWFVTTLRVLFDDHQFAAAAARTIKATAGSGNSMHRDALDIAHAALEASGNEDTRLNLLGRLTGAPDFDLGVDPDFAEQLCREAILRKPDDALAHHKLGRIYAVFRRDFANAERMYRKSIELDSKLDLPRIGLGIVLALTGRLAEAESAHCEAIELNPMNVFSWHNLGVLLAETGREAESEAAYRKAVDLEPTNASRWYNLGVTLQEVGREAEKEQAYRKAIDLEPENATAWNGLGTLLAKTNRKSEAEVAYLNAIKFNRSFPYPHANLARLIAQDSSRSNEARLEAVASLRLDPALEIAHIAFREICFDDARSLQTVLAEIGLWSAQHPEHFEVISLLVDAWEALAALEGPQAALSFLESLPAEVQLMFEFVSDAFKAHADKDHLHRLAPERRVPVMEFLRRLKTSN